MSDDTPSNLDIGADPAADKPKKAPARRRATRKTGAVPVDSSETPAALAEESDAVKAKSPNETLATETLAAGPTVDTGPTDSPEPKRATKRTPRPRKTTTKAAAIDNESAELAPSTPTAEPTEAAVEPEPVKQPARKATRRRPAKDVAPVDQAPVDEAPVGQAPVGQAPVDEARVEQAPVDQAPVDEAPVGQAPVGQAPVDEAPSHAAPFAQVPDVDLARDGLAADPSQTPRATVFAPPVVLFQAPTEVTEATPRRRASRSRKPVVEFVEVLAELPDDEALDDVLVGGAPVDDVLVDAVLVDDPDELDPDAADDELEADEAEPADEGSEAGSGRRRRRRGRRGRGSRSGADTAPVEDDAAAGRSRGKANDRGEAAADAAALDDSEDEEEGDDDARTPDEVAEAALSASARRRRRRRRSAGAGDGDAADDDPPNTVVHVRETKSGRPTAESDGVRGVKGSTRLEAKRQRRRDTRDSGRKRAPILTEAEFLARRESVERVMAVRDQADRTQIAVLEDGILVEHYVTRAAASSAVGNVYLGRVQNVLPSMEAAFLDIGRGRNGVLYAGEVNWDSARLEGKARAIENALSSGDTVLVQVTKDPIGHKGARLTSQISLPGRYVVYIPGGGMTGISRKLPDVERSRLKSILKKVVPDEAGVIVRTAAEGAAEADLISDVERLKAQWELIAAKAAEPSNSPSLVYGEPDLAIRVVRDVFNEDFSQLVVSGSETYSMLTDYLADIAPELNERVSAYVGTGDLFADLQIDEQLAKALDRKVWLPSGGSLVIDRTEAMTVVDVNTGKYTGSGGNLEQTVTRNNLEAAEELVRQLRLRDIGGIVVIDFIDMVLESNRELVLRRLTECLGRDRTKHQVSEVTSLGLIQMTRKRVGEGLLEAFSEPCEHCQGRGLIVHTTPVAGRTDIDSPPEPFDDRGSRSRRGRRGAASVEAEPEAEPIGQAQRRAAAVAIAAIAAATSGTGREELAQTSVVDEALGVDELLVPDEALVVDEALAPDELLVLDELLVPQEALRTPSEVPPPVNGAAGRPRRRRAASRPAGPPVVVDEPVTSGAGA